MIMLGFWLREHEVSGVNRVPNFIPCWGKAVNEFNSFGNHQAAFAGSDDSEACFWMQPTERHAHTHPRTQARTFTVVPVPTAQTRNHSDPSIRERRIYGAVTCRITDSDENATKLSTAP